MRLFELRRIEGVSGVGTVAQGVIFDNGWCALTWLTPHTSVAFYTSIEEVEAIHGHSGKTAVRVLVDYEDRAMDLRNSLLTWATKLTQFTSTRDWVEEMREQAGPEI
jgi:hypothetical protein